MDKSEAQSSLVFIETMANKATVCMFVLFLATTASVFGWGVQDRRSFLQTIPLPGLAIFAPESTTNDILVSNNGVGDGCVEDKDSDDEEDSDSEDDSEDDDSDEDVGSDSSDVDAE